jgi:hypothetical protein
MRTTLMGMLLAVGTGVLGITNVWATPISNGAVIGEATSSSPLIHRVEERGHRRDESRERSHRRDESRERSHRRDESRERSHRRDASRERSHRRDESRERF